MPNMDYRLNLVIEIQFEWNAVYSVYTSEVALARYGCYDPMKLLMELLRHHVIVYMNLPIDL